jgi:hypothetical protein
LFFQAAPAISILRIQNLKKNKVNSEAYLGGVGTIQKRTKSLELVC